MIERILVPLDGSAAAEHALAHLLALAPAFEAEAILLRVVPPGRTGGISHDPVEWRLDRADAGRYLSELAEKLREGGLQVGTEVREGRPAEEIVRLAHERQFDLVLMSASGHGVGQDFPLGGTAQKVLSKVETSVLVSRPAEEAGDGLAAAGYDRIVLLLDCSRRGDVAARVAARIARARGAVLEMVHVVQVPELPEPLPADARSRRLREEIVGESRRIAESYLRDLRRTACCEDVEARVRVSSSEDVVAELHGICAETGDGLTVVCSHGASRAGPGPHGGVATSLLQHAPGPVLVLQDPSRAAARPGESRTGSARAPTVHRYDRRPSGIDLHFGDVPR